MFDWWQSPWTYFLIIYIKHTGFVDWEARVGVAFLSDWSIIKPETSHLLTFLRNWHLPSWTWCHSRQWYLDTSISLRDIFGHYKGVWHKDTWHRPQILKHHTLQQGGKNICTRRNHFSIKWLYKRGYAKCFFENGMPMPSSFSLSASWIPNVSFRNI